MTTTKNTLKVFCIVPALGIDLYNMFRKTIIDEIWRVLREASFRGELLSDSTLRKVANGVNLLAYLKALETFEVEDDGSSLPMYVPLTKGKLEEIIKDVCEKPEDAFELSNIVSKYKPKKGEIIIIDLGKYKTCYVYTLEIVNGKVRKVNEEYFTISCWLKTNLYVIVYKGKDGKVRYCVAKDTPIYLDPLLTQRAKVYLGELLKNLEGHYVTISIAEIDPKTNKIISKTKIVEPKF